MDKAARGVYRGQITKLAKTALDYLNSPESQINDTNVANFDAIEEELAVLLGRLTAANQSLTEANASIRDTIKVEDLEKESEEIAEYNDKAISIITRLRQRISKLQGLQARNLEGNNGEQQHRGDMTQRRTCSTKLPKLGLKTFSGELLEWLPFWELFRTAVHERHDLNPTEKFNYLQAHLSGKAAESIRGLSPSESNYQEAIAMLKEEFGDHEKMVDRIMQQLMVLPHITSCVDVLGLRKLYNHIISSMRSLASLGVPSTSYTVMLKSIILKCMPNELTLDFYRHDEKRDYGKSSHNDADTASKADSESSLTCYGDQLLQNLLKFLKREVESLERTAQIQPRRQTQSTNKGNNNKYQTAASLLTSNEKSFSMCYFCKSNVHPTEECNATHTINHRKEMLKNEGRCFRCTKRGHTSRSCRSNRRCKKCSARHATVMCEPTYKQKQATPEYKKNRTAAGTGKDEVPVMTTTSLYSATSHHFGDVFLQTACVKALASDSSFNYLRIILDGGSQRSYVTKSVADKLKLPIVDTVKLRILPFGCKNSPSKTFERVSLVLKSRFDKQFVCVIAVVVPEICEYVLPVPSPTLPIFAQFALADDFTKMENLESGISVLIGADYYSRVVLSDFRRINENLIATNTIFGWTIQGPSDDVNYESSLTLTTPSVALCTCICEDEYIKRFWDLDTLGISNETSDNNSDININDYIVKIEGRYEAKLLWRNAPRVSESNQFGALKRFERLVNKLSNDPQKLFEYDKGINELISAGIAERVRNDFVEASCVYYLPHRPVYRYDKTTSKMRIVFDASASAHNSFSLNNHLLTGPNLLPNILEILIKFRLGMVAVVADIEKAFLQISLAKEDRDFHRFFWFEEPIRDVNERPKLSIYRMTRVTFGITCSPFLLCATLQKHFLDESKNFNETCNLLKNSFYMDDLLLSVNSSEQALKIYNESCELMKRAGMHLRKWNTNALDLRRHFNEQIYATVQKVLGLIWDVNLDELRVDLNDNPSLSTIATKRLILKTLARIFDPLGMLGPFTVGLKIMFQEAWRKNYNWDETLPTEFQSSWNNYLLTLPLLKDVAVKRCIYLSPERRSIELHVFCDASPLAYGSVAYVRSLYETGNIHVAYVCAKNRIAPLKESKDKNKTKELTLPKLELTAALVGARLRSFIVEQTDGKFESIYMWSDSMIALHWICNDHRKQNPYVAHRVREIRQLTNILEWRHCPGECNPADMLTRGLDGRKFVKSTAWINGPSWLSEPSDNWPTLDILSNNSCFSICLQTTDIITDDVSHLPFLDINHFSRYRKLLRVTAYVLRFLDVLRGNRRTNRFITAEELSGAECYWIKMIQSNEYSLEIAALKDRKSIPGSSKIAVLQPQLDDSGILRLTSRLQLADIEYEEANPIIIPKTSHLTSLIIIDAHERTLHGGINTTLNRVRERFWIIKARQAIKTAIRGCGVCKRLRGKPISQPFSPLPRNRLVTSRPFETTGVDFAGPLHIRTSLTDDHTSKVYIMLLTCAVTRAVHLELVPNLNTESCISALRRFFGRRGFPTTIISDNARTFQRCSKELKQLACVVDSEEMQNFVADKRIQWNFIVERAAWWGGFWERLVRVVKDVLKATIGRLTLTHDELETFLVEAESVINSRPLTYIGDDPLDLNPLTPSHFLTGINSTLSTSTLGADAQLRQIWKRRLKIAQSFFKRFNNEYVKQLRSAHHITPRLSENPNVGDIVILYDPATKRQQWKLAAIEAVFPGRDGKIRACEIRLPNGGKFRRAVQHLYPLELNSSAPREDVEKLHHNN